MDMGSLPQATLIFLGANIILSLYAFNNPDFFNWGKLHAVSVLKNNEWHRVLVAGFLHVDPGHLLVNMLTLWFFGPVMEQVLTPRGFFIVYLGALLLGNLGAVFRHAGDRLYSAVGASGAVSGILYAYCLVAPFSNIYVFFAIPVPAFLFAILYTLYSIYGMRAQRDNIGHDVHLIGAAAGIALAILLKPALLPNFFNEISGLFG